MEIKDRILQIKENYKNLPVLEDIYYKVCADYALLSDSMVLSIKNVQNRKRELKKSDMKSMAEFEREFELSEEYLILKTVKYQMKGFERLLSGLKVRIESLKAESKGQY